MLKTKQNNQKRNGKMSWLVRATLLLALAFSGFMASAQTVTLISQNNLSTSSPYVIRTDGTYVLVGLKNGNPNVTAPSTDLSGYIVIKSGVTATIYLNGHTLKCNTNHPIIENSGTTEIYGTYTGGSGTAGGTITGGNTARPVNGRGIKNTGELTINGITIENCNSKSENGAGIHHSGNKLLTVKNCTISNCTTTGKGGGIYSSGDVNIKGSTKIMNCSAVNNWGGGIFMSSGDSEDKPSITLNMNNGTITDCIAKSGGGVYIDNAVTDCPEDNKGIFNMYGGTITKCYATKDSDYSFQDTADPSVNKSGYVGGGVAILHSDFNMTGGTISDCYAATGAGGVYVMSPNKGYKSQFNIYEGAKITYCEGYYFGGASHVGTGSNCIMYGGEVSYNICRGGGKDKNGINFCGGGFEIGCASGSTFDIRGGKVCHNQALGESGSNPNSGYGYGGGVFMRIDGSDHGGIINIKGGAEISDNYAKEYGGGVFARATVNIDNANILNNMAGKNGGGIYFEHTCGDFTFNTGNISDNTAGKNGGALYFDNFGTNAINLTAGTLAGNHADSVGGGIYMVNSTITFGTGENEIHFNNNSAAIHGGGLYIETTSDTRDVSINNSTFEGNKASGDGGGIYLADNGNGTLTLGNGGEFKQDTAVNGGAIYVKKIKEVLMEKGTFTENVATGNGGALYVNKGDIKLTQGEATGNKAKNGGAFYANIGSVTFNGEFSVKDNKASNNGAGFFINDGNLSITNTATCVISGNEATNNGGGFFCNGGLLTIDGGTIGENGHPNKATNGGGFYMKGGTANISQVLVEYNQATNGAGLYMKGTNIDNKAIANFRTGTFSHNTASSAGGGIYIDDYAKLTMTGNSQITDNMVVPEGTSPLCAGAGVYKRGETNSQVIVSGSGSGTEAELMIYDNTINGNPNNLYLDQYNDFLTIDPEGGLPKKMQLGVSINVLTAGDFPLPTRVIYCTDFNILNGIFMKLTDAYNETHPTKEEDYSFITDDADRYLPVFASFPEPFTFEYIFFAEVWPSGYTEVPEDFDPSKISTADELTYFIMKVNGIRCEKDATIDGNLLTDIDMRGKLWVPIGGFQATPVDEKVPYSGTFHGNGHTIYGIETIGLTGTSNYGMFGETKDATIENVNLAECYMTSGQADYFGTLVGKMTNGQVLNCNVSGAIDASGSGDGNSHSGQNDGNFTGGIVGGTIGDARIKNVVSSVDIVAEFHKDINGNYDNEKYIEDSRTVGGMVGITSEETIIENGFANTTIQHGSWFPRYVGGLVGYNEGTLTNCYVRLERGVTLNIKPGIPEFYYEDHHYEYDSLETKSKFGILAGYNATHSKISNCYYPDADIHTITYILNPESETDKQIYTGTGSYEIYHPVVRPYTYASYLIDNQVAGGTTEATTLVGKLNSWVNAQDATYSHWMRTEGSPINGDYPVLNYDNLIGTLDYTTVGAKNDARIEYGTCFDTILNRFNSYEEGTLFIYKKLMKQAETRDAETKSDTIKVSNHENVKIYIEEDIPVLQAEDNELQNVYTCQVLKHGTAEYWHNIATSVSGDKIGFIYSNNDTVRWNDNPNPCNVTLEDDGENSIFPTDTPIESLDLYCFYEPEYQWLNLKRNHLSHWHMNNHDANIKYSEDDNNADSGNTLVPGKGYLAAIGKDMLLQGNGTLNNGKITIPVTVEAGTHNQGFPYVNDGTELKGYNLLGNPYQSYLSFTKFAEVNEGLWSESEPFYAVFDAESGFYTPGTAAPVSKGSAAAPGDINMHQGFFIVADYAGTARFDNTMRSDEAQEGTHFRGEAPAYPLVNLMVTDASGQGDIAVVEFDRPEYISAPKMKSIGANGKVYFRHNNDDHALLFLDEPTDHLTVCFDAANDGSYTLTWNTANANFSYLHLIDNMTGKDIDMLTNECYTFSANSDDYKARFKMVFSYTGIDEEQAETDMAEASFAFVSNGDLIVNGEGNLQLLDVNGHVLYSTRLSDTQSRVSIPDVAAGIYVVRLGEKVQKIVIR